MEKGVIWTPFFQYVRLDCGDISKHGDLKESPPNLTSYEKSKHFYVDLLGFKVIRENYRKERGDYKIDLACGTQEIELFIIKNAPAHVNYPEALVLRHLVFKVKSVDDTVKELNGKGIETEPVRLDDYTGKKMTFFHDPDGLPLEIHE